MLELSDAGIVLVHRVIYRAVALKIILRQGLEPEVQCAVGEGAELEAKQLVRLAGVDHRTVKRLPVHPELLPGQVQPLQGVCAQLHGDIGVVQELLKQGGVALQGHALIGVLEVPVVPGQEHGHPGGGVGVDLLGGLAPLLHGVVDEHVLIHIVRQGGDLWVGVLAQLQNGDLPLRAIGLQQLVPQPPPLRLAEGRLQGGEVEGDRIGHPPAGLLVGDVGDDPVLVVPPLGEAGEVVEHPLVVGVEDVGAVLVDEHPRLVQAVIGVAADVVPALQHQHPQVSPLRQLPGGDRPGEARAHNQGVKCVIQKNPAFFSGEPEILQPYITSIPYFLRKGNEIALWKRLKILLDGGSRGGGQGSMSVLPFRRGGSAACGRRITPRGPRRPPRKDPRRPHPAPAE